MARTRTATTRTQDDVQHAIEVVRMYIASWTHTRLGDECDDATRARVLDAVKTIEEAA